MEQNCKIHTGKRSHRDSARHHASRREHGSPKRAPKPDVDESSPVIQLFRQCQLELDARHDKHERIVKLSRDITIESKRTISEILRIVGHENPREVLEKARQKLSWVRRSRWRLVAEELKGEDPYRFLRAYTPGLQEYVEAVSLLHFVTEKDLLSLAHVEAQLVFTVSQEASEADKNTEQLSQLDLLEAEAAVAGEAAGEASPGEQYEVLSVHVPPLDYMLGVADLTGEMMRLAIISVGKGDLDMPFTALSFMRRIYDSFVRFDNSARELTHKLRVLKQSVKKVETACYNLQVRASEIPKAMLVDMFSADQERGENGMGDDL